MNKKSLLNHNVIQLKDNKYLQDKQININSQIPPDHVTVSNTPISDGARPLPVTFC